jgi:glutamyl-tRNA synthetase
MLAWLWARSEGLRNILRVEDLDPAAIPQGCLEGQYADLDWLGLTYDESPGAGGPVGPYRQSERFALYDEALRSLDALGVLYPCWCSRKEIQAATLAPHAADDGVVYPGTCRPERCAPLGDLADLPMRNGRFPALRLDLGRAIRIAGPGATDFPDLLLGPIAPAPAIVGDFVIRRVDGVAAYQLACAFDDAAMGCTQVLRGSDLLLSASRQALLLRLLGRPLPGYAHVGLVLDRYGERLSKRDGSIALEEIRGAGVQAAVIRRRLAGLSGLPDTGDLDLLTEAFDLSLVPPGEVCLDS